MRKGRRSLAFGMVLVLLMFLLASCAKPAAEHEPSPTPTADATISLPPKPTPTPIPEQREFTVGEVVWGPSDEDTKTPTIGDPTFYATPLEDQSQNEVFADWIYKTCYNCPTALAATAYAFPSIQAGCHINAIDPIELTNALYYEENGGQIKYLLMENLKTLLDTADLEMVSVSGMVKMGRGYVIEPNGPYLTILGFSWTKPFQVRDSIQLKVTRTFTDGSKEIGYFTNDYHCCLSVPADEDMVG